MESLTGLSVCLLALSLIGLRRGSRWASTALASLVVLLGAVRFEVATERLPRHHLVHVAARSAQVELTGRIAEEPLWHQRDLRALLEVERIVIDGVAVAACGEALVRFSKVRPDLDYGDRIRLSLRLRRPEPARNPGAFDYRAFLERKGVYGIGTVRRSEQILSLKPGEGGVFWHSVVLPLRRLIRRAINRNLAGGPAGLLKGMLLGEKRSVPEDVRQAFARSGVNHVLAVSGLHVGLIAAVAFFVFRALGLGRLGTGLATVSVLLVYAAVTRLPPSVLRACFMASAGILGALMDRDGEGLNVLGAAGLGILVWRPGDLFDAGFQLSFAATGAILLLYRPICALLPFGDRSALGKWIWVPLSVSLAAQLGTAPLVINTFGCISPVSLFANLVVVPLMAAAVGLGLLAVVCEAFVEPIVTLLNGANWLVLKAAIGAADLLSRPDWAYLSVPRVAGPYIGIYVCLLLLIVPEVRRWRGGRYLVFCCLLLANSIVWAGCFRGPDTLEIVVLDVGQGDSIFVAFPNGRTMLVDGGSNGGGVDMGQWVLIPFLRHRGLRRIDVVVGTHGHNDHTGGLVTLLEKVEVGWYLDAGQYDGTSTGRRIRDLIRRLGITYQAVAAGDSLVGLGGVEGLVLHPTPEYVSREGRAPHGANNGSVVLRLSYRGAAVLLTGDVEHETDRVLSRWGRRLEADVLKAAHHGSRTSSSHRFLAAVRPRTVIVSCGEGNRFGHPAPDVIRRYDELGLEQFRTDERGAVRVLIGRGEASASGWLDPD